MSDENNVWGTIKTILESIAILLAAFIAFRINWRFVPIIKLDISSEWLDQENGKLKLKLTIENKSNVKAVKESTRLQILEYDLKTMPTSLSEWVPFNKDDQNALEPPLFWKEPVDVWESTIAIYPGEITSLDYMYTCSKGKLLHVGLFFKGRPDLFRRFRGLRESWCTTKIIANL